MATSLKKLARLGLASPNERVLVYFKTRESSRASPLFIGRVCRVLLKNLVSKLTNFDVRDEEIDSERSIIR